MAHKNLPAAGTESSHSPPLVSKGVESPSPAKNGGGFTVAQAWVPGMLGIAIERLREMRSRVCVHGVDYRTEGGRVMFTEGALEKLRAALSVPEERTTQRVVPTENPNPPALIVRRAGPVIKNRRVVEVTVEGSEERALLWVRDNLGFRQGQRITEFRPRDVEGQYDYTGRYRGTRP